MTDHAKELAEALRGLLACTERLDFSEGYCCCGDPMDGHSNPMDCGHSPIDMGEYYAWLARKDARAALAAYDAAPAPDGIVAWQYRLKIDGAWSSWLLSEHYRSPSKAVEQRPLYVHPSHESPAPSDAYAAGMRRAADECKRLAASYTRSLAHYAEDDPQWAKIKWGAAAVTVAAENILAAIPQPGAWETPADRENGYRCLGKCLLGWEEIVWDGAIWRDVSGIPIGDDPTAFWPLPPAPAGEDRHE